MNLYCNTHFNRNLSILHTAPVICAFLDTVHCHDTECVLTTGFTGEMCQVDIDECASTPCHNGAKCLDRPNGYECECAEGEKFLSLTATTNRGIDKSTNKINFCIIKIYKCFSL